MGSAPCNPGPDLKVGHYGHVQSKSCIADEV